MIHDALPHDFILREQALELCPDEGCRRSRNCRQAAEGLPCHRTHETLDEVREHLADKLDRLSIEAGADPASLRHARPDSYGLELRLAECKRLLEARERELLDA